MVAAFGGAAIVAGGLVAAVNSAAPFAHGSWLAAYLVLVAGVSQLVLGFGCGLLSATPAGRTLLLWNTGNVAVAAGVLVSAPGVVVAGSVALLVALASFALSVGRGHRSARRWVLAYHATVLALAVSVGIGCVLASAVPS
jgi:hypothetical protein